MKRIKEKWYNLYAYLIPTFFCLIYVVVFIVKSKTGEAFDWYSNSKGFSELCQAIASFSSIILGIYGVFVPVVVGKMEEDYSKRFWSLIDKDLFVKDVKKIIVSGLLTILISSILLINDVMTDIVVNVLISIVIWTLLFFSFNTYRFIGIFSKLIVGKSNLDLSRVADMVSEDEKEKLAKLDKF